MRWSSRMLSLTPSRTYRSSQLSRRQIHEIEHAAPNPGPNRRQGLAAVAIGMRNAAVRKLGVPDPTTTVLTLTLTGLAADSSLAHGSNPRWQRRLASVLAMFAGAALGVIVVRRSVFTALAFAVVVASVCSVALLSSVRWSSQAQASMTAERHRV